MIMNEPKVSTRSRALRSVTLLAGTALMLIASGCAAFRDDEGRPLTTMTPKGPGARMIDGLVVELFFWAAVVFVLVQGAVLVGMWKFRKRKNETEEQAKEPVQTHGNPKLEWTWTILPAILLAYLSVDSIQVLWDLEERKDDAITIEVIGQQWWWEYRYDLNNDGAPEIITASQMVIPAGRQIELRIKSNDVIHSFWIPELNGKKDAIPGRINEWRLEADAPGLYQGTCTEFCGLSHAYMRMEVKALSAADYEAWLENQQQTPKTPAAGTPAAAGLEIFTAQCAACHQINGIAPTGDTTDGTPNPNYPADLASGNAPNLSHLMTRNKFAGNLFDLYTKGPDGARVPNESKMGEWLRDPTLLKPADAYSKRGMPNRNLDQEQIDALVAYLNTLK